MQLRSAFPIICLACTPLVLSGLPSHLRAADPPAEAAEFFEKKVRPVLVQHCYQCHSVKAKKLRGGLALDSRAALFKGGDSGPVVVAGQPEKSRLVEAVRYKNVDLQMPPKGRLPDRAVADLAAWVKMGAPWPDDGAAPGGAVIKHEFDLQGRKQAHWAWQPVRPRTPPDVRDAAWPRGPVDCFLLAKLQASGLKPAGEADRRTLIRRLSFALTGLPPTPEEVESFVADKASDAYERLVDRLLASPHFGERWGRHWLDLVRYGETRGHEYDPASPNAYQYRDYVIRALNADLPYNQFVVEHVAGDLLERPRRHPAEGFNESVLGTGFWFLGEEVHSPVDIRQDQADRLDNRIDVLTKAFLGLTVSCARCHDHKFDAISTRDYYALLGLLESSSYRLVRFDTLDEHRRIAAELARLNDEARRPVQRALAASLGQAAERLADYLTAAREAILAGPEYDPPASFSTAFRARIDEIAKPGKLRADVLERWVSHLLQAAGDPSDPFHVWAKVAGDGKAKAPEHLSALLQPFTEQLRKSEADGGALAGAELVVDYGLLRAGEWLPDDAGFGPGPVRSGELRLDGDANRQRLRFAERGAAEFDRCWDIIRPVSGAENDFGALGRMMRAGRTIRTPTFPLTAGKLFYLVKGACLAYASVGLHTHINGPLHGQLVQSLPNSTSFRWVAHDLTPYQGQRTHIEFTAAPGSEFAVAMVVQAERPPTGIPGAPPSRLRLTGDVRSLEELTASYQRLILDVRKRLEGDQLIDSGCAAGDAQLANWLLQHAMLFGADQEIVAAAAPYLDRRQKLIAQIRPESRLAMAALDGSGVEERVFIRGSPKALGESVPRRFLEALAGTQPLPAGHGSGRLELARQMTDPDRNPFIGRVIVNRVWHHLFGRGLAASVDNFGALGDAPTHPELLDYLADEFVRDGWSVKRLVRRLVLSSAYRMAAHADEAADRADPQVLLLHRMRVRRLEGEAIRDALLAVSGRLDRRLYGPSVPVYLTPFLEGRGRPASGPLDGDGRRSVYLAVRRNFLSPFLLAFDTPIPFSTVGRRTVSNVPAQALILLNDLFVHQQAEVWARKVLAYPGTARERITAMYLGAFARPPSADELAACLEYVAGRDEDVAAWAGLAHTLVNVKVFIFVN